ncbi:MAG: dihydroorotase [Firmicutes bacterium]|nr:dihydroorotase [Bacillota bacterium]
MTDNGMTGVCLRGVRVIDPFRDVDSRDEDLTVVGGLIVPRDDPRARGCVEIDGRGLWLVPRIVDMHVHFREPGQTWKETIETGCQAAAHGGVTGVAPMPNTLPVVDTPELVEWEAQRGADLGLVHVYPIGAITRQSQGEALADLYFMHQKGARAFSDDGHPLTSSALMRAALTYAATLPAAIINHAEDRQLATGWCNEGPVAEQLGLAGTPEAAEAVMVWRDVMLAELTGGWLHEAHVSTVESLHAIRYAKAKQLGVTAEVTPHHLLLTDDALREWRYDPVTKVNPPLRSKATREALVKAVSDGDIDVIASDHAPHHADEKSLNYQEAPYGISGLETLLGATFTALLEPGLMRPLDLMRLLTVGPHRVLRLSYPGLIPGAAADLTLIDPQRRWVVDPGQFYSRGRNTPLAGRTLVGQAVATMVQGRWVMRDGEVLNAGVSNLHR